MAGHGAFDQMTDAAGHVRTVARRTGLKTGVPEEIAWRQELSAADELTMCAEKQAKSGSEAHLLNLLQAEH
jgi:glucose-1-phosphate thymidylyltransferase